MEMKRTTRWRYTKWADGGEEPYDLEKDPAENHNLVANATHPKIPGANAGAI